MSACTRALLALAVIGLSLPLSAQTPATTAFDGRYLGVSIEVSNSASHPGPCAPGRRQAGTASHYERGRSHPWQGVVGRDRQPSGVIVMHNPNSLRVDAQIDAQGTIQGQYSGPSCINTYVWRKQSG